MQQTAKLAIQHEPHGQGPFVIPVRAVGRVRIRTRLRRARTDLLPLYIGADLLKQMRIYFSREHRKMYVTLLGAAAGGAAIQVAAP